MSLQQIYVDNFNARAHEYGDEDKEDDSPECVRQSHRAAWLAVAEHIAHANAYTSASELLGPHPVLEPQESKAWLAHFGDASPAPSPKYQQQAAAAHKPSQPPQTTAAAAVSQDVRKDPAYNR